MNRRGDTFEIITYSLCKRKLQQDQENMTKTNNQIKPEENKPKLKAKQPQRQ